MVISTQSRTKQSKASIKRNNPNGEDAKYIYRLDIIFLILVFFFAVPYLTFIRSNYSQSLDPVLVNLAFKGGIALDLLNPGLILILFFAVFYLYKRSALAKRVKIELSFLGLTKQSATNLITSLGVGTFAISFFNFLLFQNTISPRFDISGTDLLLFSVTMGIVEEVIFSSFQILIVFLFNSSIPGIILRPIIFLVYHNAVYGADPLILISVIWAGTVLAITFEISNNLSNNMLIHAFVNIIPVLLGGVF